MQQPINFLQPNSGAPFTNGAISEDELEHVIGGLARAWVEEIAPAPVRPEAAVGQLAWDRATGPAGAE